MVVLLPDLKYKKGLETKDLVSVGQWQQIPFDKDWLSSESVKEPSEVQKGETILGFEM